MRTKGKEILVATRVPVEMHRRIAKLAEAERRTISNYLRVLVERAIEEQARKSQQSNAAD